MRESQPSNFGVAFETSEDDIATASPGGQVKKFTAAVALNVGDGVLLSAANTATKNLTAGDHTKRIGIVVGGKQTHMRALSGSDAVGLAAAAANETVIVQTDGIAWGVADEGASAVAAGVVVQLGTTTAGRLLATAAAATKIIGMALDTAVNAGDKFRVLISRA